SPSAATSAALRSGRRSMTVTTITSESAPKRAVALSAGGPPQGAPSSAQAAMSGREHASASARARRHLPLRCMWHRLLEIAAQIAADLRAHLLIKIGHERLGHVVPSLVALVGRNAFEDALRARHFGRHRTHRETASVDDLESGAQRRVIALRRLFLEGAADAFRLLRQRRLDDRRVANGEAGA